MGSGEQDLGCSMVQHQICEIFSIKQTAVSSASIVYKLWDLSRPEGIWQILTALQHLWFVLRRALSMEYKTWRDTKRCSVPGADSPWNRNLPRVQSMYASLKGWLEHEVRHSDFGWFEEMRAGECKSLPRVPQSPGNRKHQRPGLLKHWSPFACGYAHSAQDNLRAKVLSDPTYPIEYSPQTRQKLSEKQPQTRWKKISDSFPFKTKSGRRRSQRVIFWMLTFCARLVRDAQDDARCRLKWWLNDAFSTMAYRPNAWEPQS